MTLSVKHSMTLLISLQAHKVLAFAAFLVSILLIPATRGADTLVNSAATDWPQWNGPNRDGVSRDTGLLKQWPKEGPPLAWKAHGIGEGMGGVAVTGGRIYVAGDDADTAWLFALNEADGKPFWKAKVGRGGKVGASGQFHPGPRATANVDGDKLYILSQYGDLACFTTDGKDVWRVNLKDFGGTMPTWAYSESPLIDGDKVICTPGGPKGTMLALDKNTGKPIWQSKQWTEEAQYSSAIVATIGGVRQYIQQTARTVAGVAAKDGRVLWTASRPEGRIVISSPIEKDGLVYVSAGYGVGCHCFRITPPQSTGGKFSAEKVYSNRDMKNHHGGVILFNGYVYGSNDPGILVCMDFKTGKVAWSNRSIGKGSMVIADGHVYLRGEQPPGVVALIEASPAGYKQISAFSPPDASGKPEWPHPVIANGKLYLRDQDVLLCYDIKAKP